MNHTASARLSPPSAAPAEARRHGTGIVLVTASAVAYSTAGYFTRLIHLDPWTILFWRGVFAGVFIGAVIVAHHRRGTPAAVRAIGVPGLIAASMSTIATIMFINAFRRTSVADVTIIFATAPFMTAALGWCWIRERESWPTLLASAVAFAGAVVMVGGAATAGRLAGDVLAIGMTFCMSIMMLIIRRYRKTPMLPAACLSAFLCSLAVLPFARPASPGVVDMVLLVLFGTTQFGLGLLLLTLGARLVSATESALMNALEGPLAPLWVWLAFAEVPPRTTLIGGSIVLAAVFGHIAASARSRRVLE